jgi:hypothetical protein
MSSPTQRPHDPGFAIGLLRDTVVGAGPMMWLASRLAPAICERTADSAGTSAGKAASEVSRTTQSAGADVAEAAGAR